MNKYILSLIFLCGLTLISCGTDGGLYYDPILKYENAGYTCTRFLPPIDNWHRLTSWYISNIITLQYKPADNLFGSYAYNTITKQVSSIGFIGNIPVWGFDYAKGKYIGANFNTKNEMYEISISPQGVLTNKMSSAPIILPGDTNQGYWNEFSPSGRILLIGDSNTYILDTNKNVLTNIRYAQFDSFTGGKKFISTYSNLILSMRQGIFLLINLFDFSTNSVLVSELIGQGFYLECASPKEKYLVIRKFITYPDFIDGGLAIVDLVNKTCTDLYNMDGVNYQASLLNDPGITLADPQQGPLLFDQQGYISPDLKKIAFSVYWIPSGQETISGRTADELRGLWTIDISSLGLTE